MHSCTTNACAYENVADDCVLVVTMTCGVDESCMHPHYWAIEASIGLIIVILCVSGCYECWYDTGSRGEGLFGLEQDDQAVNGDIIIKVQYTPWMSSSSCVVTTSTPPVA